MEEKIETAFCKEKKNAHSKQANQEIRLKSLYRAGRLCYSVGEAD